MVKESKIESIRIGLNSQIFWFHNKDNCKYENILARKLAEKRNIKLMELRERKNDKNRNNN